MKNLISLFTVLFILLTSSVSWGSVDGKGLMCRDKPIENDSKHYPYFLIFENGTVKYNEIKVSNDIVITTNSSTTPYSTSLSTINWYVPHFFGTEEVLYTLNRKDLSLKQTFNDVTIIHFCEVFPKELLMEIMNELLKLYQSEYDKKRKGNKI